MSDKVFIASIPSFSRLANDHISPNYIFSSDGKLSKVEVDNVDGILDLYVSEEDFESSNYSQTAVLVYLNNEEKIKSLLESVGETLESYVIQQAARSIQEANNAGVSSIIDLYINMRSKEEMN